MFIKFLMNTQVKIETKNTPSESISPNFVTWPEFWSEFFKDSTDIYLLTAI